MSQKKALIIFAFFDLLALFVFWLGYDEINKVIADVANSADMVKFNNRIGFFFLGVCLPPTHIFLICRYFWWPKILEKKDVLVNLSCFILGIVLFASAIFISAYMRTYVERAGYLRCPKADKRMTFSTYLMYTKNYEICSRLVEEKRIK